MKLLAKFKSQEEVAAVRQAAKYVGMTEKQFLRVAAIKAVQDIQKQLQELLRKQQEQQLQAQQEKSDVRSDAEVQHQTTTYEAAGLNPGSSSTGSAVQADEEDGSNLDRPKQSQLQPG